MVTIPSDGWWYIWHLQKICGGNQCIQLLVFPWGDGMTTLGRWNMLTHTQIINECWDESTQQNGKRIMTMAMMMMMMMILMLMINLVVMHHSYHDYNDMFYRYMNLLWLITMLSEQYDLWSLWFWFQMFDIYCLLIERLLCSLLFIYMATMIMNIIHFNSF